ncbi:hypothetical protein PC116_g21332 [Phytophthora cactorum]|uniref:DDE Tnp4 domain-containing protein n=2 Tax=Phytophthora cactorum TaxID=29920 RepID=A0A8T1C5A7_9STRA|nr:hypothetical protein PC115_g23047 [Phytophthora cactorum]KAG2914795.1 hypothetical protein PC117_g18214 [Phytophthora cactorum]KAG3068387.1 hypothetical protein PC122_g16962 [Phytophthora cactorum]KAG4230368.1 hypothetical protein PC116_g21332 [Phytophthora cactorum]
MPRPSRRQHLESVLLMLQERDNSRRQELEEYPRVAEESESGDAILRLTNFTPRELNTLWMSVRAHVTLHWNVGRGQHSVYKGKNVLFMLLVVMKNGGTWEMLSSIFHVKTPTFIKTITGFIRAIAPRLYDDWVAEKAQEDTMRMLVTSGNTFVYHPCALYATDVTFQQANRPAGSMAEKPFPSTHARGNTLDITLFRHNEAFHHATRRKSNEDRSLRDVGLMNTEYPDEWAVLTDKGYQGLEQHVRCIHPMKGSNPKAAAAQQNADISSDRIIVENWFGRLCGHWRICADKYRWGEDLYDDIFQTCAALTNYHIGYYPLRSTNGDEYRQRQNRLVSIGREMQKKRRRAQDRYRERRRLRQRMSLEDRGCSEGSDDDEDLTQL